VLRQIIGDRYANAIARRLKARLARYRPTAAASPATATQIVPELHWVDKLLLVGAEPALMRFLKRHVFAGDIGSTAGRFPSIEGSAIDIQAGPSGQKIDGCNLVGGPYTLDGITVWVVDGVFQPGKAR
jgi:hypothetical protein